MIQEAYIQGISTRSVDDLVKVMGMSGISKSEVSRLCEEIDGKVKAFLERPIEGDWPYLGIMPPTSRSAAAAAPSRSRPSSRWTPTPTDGAGCWACRSVPRKPSRSGPSSCAN